MEPANKAKFSVDLTKRQMEQLDAKIVQRWKQIAECQQMDDATRLLKAQRALQKMQEMRTRLGARLAAVHSSVTRRVWTSVASKTSSATARCEGVASCGASFFSY